MNKRLLAVLFCTPLPARILMTAGLFFLFFTFCPAQTYYIYTFAGNGTTGFSGDGGQATNAELSGPVDVCIDNSGNFYIADVDNNRIRVVNSSGIITTIAGNGTLGYSGDGGPATLAELNGGQGVAIDLQGNLYIAEAGDYRIRKINTSGIISTLAGNGTYGFSGDGGSATLAEVSQPTDVETDDTNNVYIADGANQRIRKVNTNGIITTVAGNGFGGFSGDGAQATAAELRYPAYLKIDHFGNMYIADDDNQRVRMVNTSGVIRTIAGNGTAGYNGDNIRATTADLNYPDGICTDTSGNLYIADNNNQRIRKVDATNTITTFAGDGHFGFAGDGGFATSAELYMPTSVTIDKAQNFYISDYFNDRVRIVTTSQLLGITGIEERKADLMVEPNPFRNFARIMLNSEGNYFLEVFDITGKKLKDLEFSGRQYQLSAEGLEPGLYFLKVSDSSKKVIGTRKIMVE